MRDPARFHLLLSLLALGLFAAPLAAANTHVATYRLDPTPRPGQDFTLFITLKNDIELPADKIRLFLTCPPDLECPTNLSAALPSYGMQEIAIPISNRAPGGLRTIVVTWEDGTYKMTTGPNDSPLSVKQNFTTSIPILIRPSSISSASATTRLHFNEANNFSFRLNATDLSNVRLSLYSTCMAFQTPLFYLPQLEGEAAFNTSAFVNCAPGSADVILTLQSDEMSYQIPFGVFIDKRAQAKPELEFEHESLITGKDRLLIHVRNDGAAAEKVYLTFLPSPGFRSPDVVYLGDLAPGEQRLATMEVEADDAGNHSFGVEARWIENKETFTQTWESSVNVSARPPRDIPAVVWSVLGIGLILWVFWTIYTRIFARSSKNA